MSLCRVRVYRNLTKGCWSIQREVPGKGWRLWQHADKAQVICAIPKVYESGRQRVIREKKKYVHAYLEGWLITSSELSHEDERPVRYNPYHGPDFLIDGEVVRKLQVAHFGENGKVTGAV